jgi:predicted nuclease with TOPRIM domain
MSKMKVKLIILLFAIFTIISNVFAKEASFTQEDRERLRNIELRLERFEARFEGIDKRFEQMEKRFEQIDKRLEFMQNFM